MKDEIRKKKGYLLLTTISDAVKTSARISADGTDLGYARELYKYWMKVKGVGNAVRGPPIYRGSWEPEEAARIRKGGNDPNSRYFVSALLSLPLSSLMPCPFG